MKDFGYLIVAVLSIGVLIGMILTVVFRSPEKAVLENMELLTRYEALRKKLIEE